MVWAPSAIPNGNGFDVFWSSRLFAPGDKAHTGKASLNVIRTAKTTNFASSTEPRTYISDPDTPYIDQEFIKVDGGWVRFLKDESKVSDMELSSPGV